MARFALPDDPQEVARRLVRGADDDGTRPPRALCDALKGASCTDEQLERIENELTGEVMLIQHGSEQRVLREIEDELNRTGETAFAKLLSKYRCGLALQFYKAHVPEEFREALRGGLLHGVFDEPLFPGLGDKGGKDGD